MSTPESKIIITADVSKVSEGFARVEADATRLTGALGKIGREGFKGLEQSARQGLGGLQSQLSGLTSVVTRVTGALALLGGAAVAFNSLRNVINEIDALNDTADATGASIENLSALESIGRRVGTSFDTVSSILVKFNAQLEAAGDPASEAAQAFKALGLSADELRKLDPAVALQKTAQALAGYADNADKARLIQVQFGKSVRDAAPFLKDLAEAGDFNARVTAEQAEEASRFNKQLADLQANANQLGRDFALTLLPSLNDVLGSIRDASAAFDGLSNAPLFTAPFRFSPFDDWSERAEEARKSIADLSAELEDIQRRKVNPGLLDKFFGADVVSGVEQRVQGRLKEQQQLLAFFERRLASGNQTTEEPKPKISFTAEAAVGKAVVASPRESRLGNPLSTRLRTRSVSDDGLGQILREYERRQEEAARFGEQLQEQTAQINVSLIQDDRERGLAQIELDRSVMQSRLDVLKIGGVNVTAAQQALNENIVARQQALTDALKPEWQRMLESWRDTTSQMAKTYDSVMNGVVARTEEVLAEFVTTGRLNVRSLADFVIGEIARMQARALAAKIFDAADLLINGFSVTPNAKGNVFSTSGITAFASGGVVDKPTFFGYAGGRTGLMGEAGPEAIMPLTRGPDGKLGVKSQGSQQAVNVTINAQAGVTRAELAAMLPMIREQLKAELVGSMRRPGFAG